MTTCMLKDREDPSPVQLGRLIHSVPGAEFDIHLFKRRGSYAVQYGLQLDHSLSYGDAAAKLGEAIMHSLACQGRMD